MRICGKITALFALVLVLGCSSGDKTAVLPDRLRAVPSDALAVCSGTCLECLSVLDTSHVFHKIGLERYSGEPAVLAYCYTSTISPILVIDADIDSSVFSKAAKAGVYTCETEYESESGADITDRIVFAVSESTMAAVRRHLSMGTSVLDAHGFEDAAAEVASCNRWTILHNSDLSKLLPRQVLGGYYDRKDIVRLLRSFCEWTGCEWTSDNECRLYPVNGNDASYLSYLMNLQKPSQSRLNEILPSATELAVDLPVDSKSFRKSYTAYLDANQHLSAYEKNLDVLRKNTGINPVEWEKALGVSEVAMVGWEGRKVILVRPSAKMEVSEPGANACPGFTSALYGFPFGLKDDSFCAKMDGWLVLGTENDVRVFLDEERPETFSWPARPLKFAIYTLDAMFEWTNDAIKIKL